MRQNFFRGCRADLQSLLNRINEVGDVRMEIGEEPYGIYQDDRNGKQYCCYKAELADGQIIYLSANLMKWLKERNIVTKVEGSEREVETP